jgi:hypothetical protein
MAKNTSKEVVEFKTFNIRMPKDMWMFLKKASAMQETSMTDILMSVLDKYRKKIEPKLNVIDTNV